MSTTPSPRTAEDPRDLVPSRVPPVLPGTDLVTLVLHPRAFFCELHIGPGHLSRTVEHVSNVEYLRWLDRAAELHGNAVGYSRRMLMDEGIMWFVARHEIDYRAEVFPDERLVIATWVRDMDRVRSWRDTVVIRPADETVVCQAATLWVLVDLATRRPQRIPRLMIERFDPLGNFISSFDTGPLVSGIVTVGDEVWLAYQGFGLTNIDRVDLNGVFLGTFDTVNARDPSDQFGFAFVPEPSTALLMGLGLIALSVRKRREV